MTAARSARILDLSARSALFLTLGAPLYLAPGFLFPFVSVRGLVLRALIAVAGICILLRALSAERVARGRRDWTLIALAVFLVVNAASAAFGFSWQRSVFGTLARLGGLWTIVHLFLLYVLLRIAFEERHWRWYLRGIVAIGLLAAAYGLLQRYQVALGIVWEGAPNPPNGPLGNYGIFAGYLLFPIAVAAYLGFAESSAVMRRASLLALLPLLWILWLTTNRSSVLGLAAGVVAASVYYSSSIRRGRRIAAAVVVLVIAAGAAVHSMRPGRALASVAESMPYTVRRFADVAPTSTGLDRRLQWKAAVRAAGDRPLLGYGPENHEIVWTRHFDPAIYAITSDQLWDRTHNAYFEALGTTGALGLAALLLLWAVILVTIDRRRRAGALTSAEAAVLVGLHVAYAVYLWFWFFDITAMALWVTLAAFVASRAQTPVISIVGSRPWRPQSVLIAFFTVFAGATLVWMYSLSPLIEARRLGRLQALTDGRSVAKPSQALREFRLQLSSTSPYGVPGTALFSRYLSALRPVFPQLRQDSAFVHELAPTLQRSLVSLGRARAADPLNDRLMTVKTRIMIRASQFYGSPEIAARAEATAREEVALAPRRVGPRLILAGLLAENGRHEEALAQTDSALSIHPRSPDAHGVRATIFFSAGNADSAAAELVAAMPPLDTTAFAEPSPPRTDPEVVLRVASALADEGEAATAAGLLRHYMMRWYGDFPNWRRGTVTSLATARLDRAIASMLPALELRAENVTGAREAALGFQTVCGPARDQVNAFLLALGDPRRAIEAYPRSVASGGGDLAVIVADVTRLCEPGAVR